MRATTVADFRQAAKRKLPHFLFEYLDGGSFYEETLRKNLSDFSAIGLRQRVLAANGGADLGASLFGKTYRLPIVLAPVGLAGLYARRGEAQGARAAAAYAIPYSLSTVSACSIEEVTGAAGEAPWFQLYVTKDKALTAELLDRAARAGVTTLQVTVDLCTPAPRYRDVRSGLAHPPSFLRTAARYAQIARRPSWAWDVGIRGRPHVHGNLVDRLGKTANVNRFWPWIVENLDHNLSWDDIACIRKQWKGSFIVKGILEADDARRAVDAGADGIVVSNHGGRQLDGAPSSISALPAVSEAIGNRIAVLFDSGIRSGVDVVRALGLGANAVMVGRPWIYALAAYGQRGVTALLDQFEKEIRIVLALTGCTSLSEVKDIVVRDK